MFLGLFLHNVALMLQYLQKEVHVTPYSKRKSQVFSQQQVIIDKGYSSYRAAAEVGPSQTEQETYTCVQANQTVWLTHALSAIPFTDRKQLYAKCQAANLCRPWFISAFLHVYTQNNRVWHCLPSLAYLLYPARLLVKQLY